MSNLVPFEPFREMVSLRDAMNRLFEESFLRPGVFESENTAVLAPVDVYETKDNIVLKAAVPGLKPEDLDISITGDVLTIKGEYKSEDQQPEGQGEQGAQQGTQAGRNYFRRERRFGSFTRQLTLPMAVDTNNVSATFENGILTLEMPKKEAVKPKSVKIVAKK
jgi:HSP20 family protein